MNTQDCKYYPLSKLIKCDCSELAGITSCRVHFHALEKEMATHSSVVAWRIPWTEEPGGLQSMGFQRVRHN